MTTTKKTWNGHTWEIDQLGEDRFSIRCLDSNRAVDGTDCTEWPTDEILSDWCGAEIVGGDAGDDPDCPEWIAHVAD